MPSLPGSKPWHASLMGFVQTDDWGGASGIIVFKDGTIWSYEDQSPRWGDEYWEPEGFAISEKKVGSDFWERLTPDAWGNPYNSQVSGYPNWPSKWSNVADAQMSGDLSVAPVYLERSDQDHHHVMDPNDPDVVWFLSADPNNLLGPLSVNKRTRRWTRYLTSSSLYWQAQFNSDETSGSRSNWVIHGGYFYWFVEWYVGATSSMKFVRAPVSNPANVAVLHEWVEGGTWYANLNTSNINLLDTIDNQFMSTERKFFSIDDDGYVYFFTDRLSRLWDSRTLFEYKNPDARMYDKKYCFLRRFKIGDYKLETVMWHTMNPEWYGKGSADGWGTLQQSTIGTTTNVDGRKYEEGFDKHFPAVGMGMDGTVFDVNDGWLYWWDHFDNDNGWGYDGTDPGLMLCRIELSKLNPEEPIHHDIMNPAFEVITQGSTPWEGADYSHYGDEGPHITTRGGGRPILPNIEVYWSDRGIAFLEDGTIMYKGPAYPPYISYNGGIDWFLFATEAIWKLTPYTDKWATNVTVTFDGDELKGYANVREVPSRSNDLEVELS